MTGEHLVPVSGLSGSCTSTEAMTAATRIAGEWEIGVRPWRVGTEDGCDLAGRSGRWEVRFDLAARRQEAVVTVAFTVDEETGSAGEGVASLRLLPYPSEGSELAKMVRAGQITGRRLRAVWRQQLRDHEPLPADFPDSVALAAFVAPEPVRSAYARMTRQRGFVWVTETPGQTRHIRAADFR